MRDLGPGRLGQELFLAAFGLAFDGIEPWVVDRIAGLLQERWVEKGEVLYRQGEPPEYLHFMLDGSVKLTRDDAPSWTMRGKWVVGALEGLAGSTRPRTATALTSFRAMQAPIPAWVELLEDSFQLARGAIVNAARATAQLEARVPRMPPLSGPRWAHPAVEGAPLSLVDRLALLAEVRMLGGAGVQSLVDLAAATRESSFEAGSVLLERGAERREILLVVSGEVEADRRDPLVERTYGPGDIVCGPASFGAPGPAWEARAATPVRLVSFPVEFWFDLMEEHFDLVRSTLGALGTRRELLLDAMASREGDLVLT